MSYTHSHTYVISRRIRPPHSVVQSIPILTPLSSAIMRVPCSLAVAALGLLVAGLLCFTAEAGINVTFYTDAGCHHPVDSTNASFWRLVSIPAWSSLDYAHLHAPGATYDGNTQSIANGTCVISSSLQQVGVGAGNYYCTAPNYATTNTTNQYTLAVYEWSNASQCVPSEPDYTKATQSIFVTGLTRFCTAQPGYYQFGPSPTDFVNIYAILTSCADATGNGGNGRAPALATLLTALFVTIISAALYNY